MADFVEIIDCSDNRMLINTKCIEEIVEEGDERCIIYMAFNTPNAVEQDFVLVNESYADLKNRILHGQSSMNNNRDNLR